MNIIMNLCLQHHSIMRFTRPACQPFLWLSLHGTICRCDYLGRSPAYWDVWIKFLYKIVCCILLCPPCLLSKWAPRLNKKVQLDIFVWTFHAFWLGLISLFFLDLRPFSIHLIVKMCKINLRQIYREKIQQIVMQY